MLCVRRIQTSGFRWQCTWIRRATSSTGMTRTKYVYNVARWCSGASVGLAISRLQVRIIAVTSLCNRSRRAMRWTAMVSSYSRKVDPDRTFPVAAARVWNSLFEHAIHISRSRLKKNLSLVIFYCGEFVKCPHSDARCFSH